jgi:aminoglycoside 6'-N-acetyltransferase I
VTTVRGLEAADWQEWRRMRSALWPDHPAAEHEADMRAWLARSDAAVMVCARDSGGLCGFAEVGTRPYADGCRTSPVAFLEGWYVDPDSRGAGLGRLLVEAVEAWARARGLRELASDTLLDNAAGQRAHEHLGFVEVERAVRYRKGLTDVGSAPDRPAQQ